MLVPPIQGTKKNVQKGPNWLDTKLYNVNNGLKMEMSGPFWTLSLVPWMGGTNTGEGPPLFELAIWEDHANHLLIAK